MAIKKKRGRKKNKGLIIKKKVLNNKSRKGDYYYIKEGSNKPAYYKIVPNVSLDNYLMAYRGKIRIKKKGVIQYSKLSPAQKYLKKVGKSRKIEDLIGKGITETTISNLKYTGRKRTHTAYVNMLSPLVKDKELLRILALEENVNKFKHRIQTIVTLSSIEGDMEINLKVFNKSLSDISNDFKSITKKVDVVENDLWDLMDKGYKMDGIPKGVDITGSKYHVIARKLGKIRVKLRFVKAK